MCYDNFQMKWKFQTQFVQANNHCMVINFYNICKIVRFMSYVPYAVKLFLQTFKCK